MMNRGVLIILIPLLFACSEDESPETQNDNFDRQSMLINWADNIIIPSYKAYEYSLLALQSAKNDFIANPDISSLSELRIKWEEAYLNWQKVSMFQIGMAEQITLRDFTNIYPCDKEEIEMAISSGDYNLELPSSRDMQGFPALDYLLYGMADSENELLQKLSQTAYSSYLSELVERLLFLSQSVIDDWEGDYRDQFVENDGSDAGSSVNKMLNDYMFYYEKVLRAGKVGIPAGVFSSTSRSDLVEAPYRGDLSKSLCLSALNSVINFFHGRHYNSNEEGESLKSYLDYLNSVSETESLSLSIANQFDLSRDKIESLNEDFALQIQTDNSAMLEAYDELQSNVVLMKVDMFQAMNIRVDYVDADGD
ncbi:imelysin family protein [Hyphobacterium sp. CCMP332]|nr:imelysin family protein [Hyphobacterium sp. CCMP332]